MPLRGAEILWWCARNCTVLYRDWHVGHWYVRCEGAAETVQQGGWGRCGLSESR